MAGTEGEAYANNKEFNDKMSAELLPDLLVLTGVLQRQNAVYLDFGCGDGSTCMRYLVPLAEATNSKILAVDISQGMIQWAQTHNAHPRITYVCGDILAQGGPLQGMKFDFIFALYVLHFTDFKKVLAKFTEHLNTGGKLLALIAESHLARLFGKLKADPFWAEHVGQLGTTGAQVAGTEGATDEGPGTATLRAYLPILEEQQLKVLQAAPHQVTYLFKRLETLTRACASMFPSCPKELQEKLRDWLAEQFLKAPQPKDVMDQRALLRPTELKTMAPLHVVMTMVVIAAEQM